MAETTDEKDACITQTQVARSLQLENELTLTGKGNPMEVADLAAIREEDMAIFYKYAKRMVTSNYTF